MSIDRLSYNLPAFSDGSRRIKGYQYASNAASFTSLQDARITLPSKPRSFYDNLMLCGSIEVDISGGTPGADLLRFIGSFQSLIRAYQMRFNQTQIESMYNCNIVANAAAHYSLSAGTRMNLLPGSSQKNGRSLGGVVFNEAASGPNSKFYSFAIPILGLLSGEQAICSDKVEVDTFWTFEDENEMFMSETGIASVDGYTVKNLRIEFESVELTPEAFSRWYASNTLNNVLTYSYSTWLYSSALINASSQGFVQVSLGSKPKSARGVMLTWQVANASGGKFSSVLPNFDRLSVNIGGTVYPRLPLDSRNQPDALYAHCMSDWLGSAHSTKGNCMTRKNFFVASTGNDLVRPYKDNTPDDPSWDTDMIENCAYVYISFENHGENGVISGVEATGPPQVELNIPDVLAAQLHTMHAFFYCDAKLMVDYGNNTITNIV